MAGLTVCNAMRRIRGLNVMLVLHGLHRIGEVDVANIECLERMDRVGVGINRPWRHLQVRTATLRGVTEPADYDIPTSIR